jgi:hypothetical protein
MFHGSSASKKWTYDGDVRRKDNGFFFIMTDTTSNNSPRLRGGPMTSPPHALRIRAVFTLEQEASLVVL